LVLCSLGITGVVSASLDPSLLQVLVDPASTSTSHQQDEEASESREVAKWGKQGIPGPSLAHIDGQSHRKRNEKVRGQASTNRLVEQSHQEAPRQRRHEEDAHHQGEAVPDLSMPASRRESRGGLMPRNRVLKAHATDLSGIDVSSDTRSGGPSFMVRCGLRFAPGRPCTPVAVSGSTLCTCSIWMSRETPMAGTLRDILSWGE
jgi:hypothetical protein